MILRRLTAAFRKQDWFTVLAEIMVVVLGVFLGLQVNNWNEDRGERGAEIGYLASLEDDIRFSIDSLDDIIARMQEQQSKRAALYSYSIDPDATMASAAFAQLLHGGLYQGAPLRINNTTFESLKNSGQLSLLKSVELTSGLQALSEKTEYEYERNASEFQVMYLFSDPLLVKHFPLGEMFKRQTALGSPLISWLDEIRPVESLPAFAKSVEFGNIVLYRSNFTEQRLRGAQELLELCRDILGLIDERQAALGVGQ